MLIQFFCTYISVLIPKIGFSGRQSCPFGLSYSVPNWKEGEKTKKGNETEKKIYDSLICPNTHTFSPFFLFLFLFLNMFFVILCRLNIIFSEKILVHFRLEAVQHLSSTLVAISKQVKYSPLLLYCLSRRNGEKYEREDTKKDDVDYNDDGS